MDRNEFLKMCQKCSVLKIGVMEIKQNVPKELRVIYNGTEYYPIKYQIGFDNNGKAIHIAIIHDLKAHSEIYCKLENIEKAVESVEKENK